MTHDIGNTLLKSKSVADIVAYVIREIRLGGAIEIDGTIIVSIRPISDAARFMVIPYDKWNDDPYVKRNNMAATSGFHQAGIVVVRGPAYGAGYGKKVSQALSENGNQYRSVAIHELTHLIDSLDNKIPKGKSLSGDNLKSYFRAGWEQEARFQEIIDGLIHYVVDRTILQDTWAETRSYFLPPSKHIAGFVKAQMHRGFAGWEHLTEKNRRRVIARLIQAYPIVAAKCVTKLRSRLAEARRYFAGNNARNTIEKIESEMSSDKALKEMGATYVAAVSTVSPAESFLLSLSKTVNRWDYTGDAEDRFEGAGYTERKMNFLARSTGIYKKRRYTVYFGVGMTPRIVKIGPSEFAVELPSSRIPYLKMVLSSPMSALFKALVIGMNELDTASRSVLYHSTSTESALNILKSRAFIGQWSGRNQSESAASNGWFVSLSRSINGNYQTTHRGVWLVFDGDALRSRYVINPVSYYGTRESNAEYEERLVSKKQTIPYGKTLREIWLFAPDKNSFMYEKETSALRKVVIEAKKQGIKTKVFKANTPKNKLASGVIPATELTAKYTDKTGRPTIRGIDSYDWNDYLVIRELVKASSTDKLGKRSRQYARHPIDLPAYISAALASKNPKLQIRYANLMKEAGANNIKELIEVISTRWHNIKEREYIIDFLSSYKNRLAYHTKRLEAASDEDKKYIKEDIDMLRRDTETYKKRAGEFGISESEINKMMDTSSAVSVSLHPPVFWGISAPKLIHTFNPVNMLRVIASSKHRNAVIRPGKFHSDVLLAMYLKHLDKLMPLNPIEEPDKYRLRELMLKVVSQNKDTASMEGADSLGIMEATQEFFFRLKQVLGQRQYRREPDLSLMGLELVEYRPSRRAGAGAQRPFLPNVSLIIHPDTSMVYDVFVNNERLSPFAYGATDINQIEDPYSGSALNDRVFQYRNGLMQVLARVVKEIDAGRAKARLFKIPKKLTA